MACPNRKARGTRLYMVGNFVGGEEKRVLGNRQGRKREKVGGLDD